MSDPLIRATGVSRTFPVGRARLRALDGVDVAVLPGETLGLVGESGCGKSTLARLLIGLDRPSQGRVHFDGQDLSALPEAALRRLRRRFQMVFQDPVASLNPRMTARDAIAEPLENLSDLDPAAIAARVTELAGQVGLGAHHLNRFPHELSGGQCQRVGLARAIAVEPDLIVADEPVSALDVSIQAQILNLILAIKARMGLAMVFVSHDLSVVAHIADRVAVMYLGRIVETGPAEAVFRAPRHPYTRMLLAAVPHPVPPDAIRAPADPATVDPAGTGAGPGDQVPSMPEPTDAGARMQVRGELPSPLAPPPGCHFHNRCPLADARCQSEVPALLPDAPETTGGAMHLHRTACHRTAEAAR